MPKKILKILAGAFMMAGGVFLFLVSDYLQVISISLLTYVRFLSCGLYLLGAFIIAAGLTMNEWFKFVGRDRL